MSFVAMVTCLLFFVRADEADDILLSGTEIKQIAMAIEDELYRCFGAVTSKYKNRYRSLTFNIRDPKNKVSRKC